MVIKKEQLKNISEWMWSLSQNINIDNCPQDEDVAYTANTASIAIDKFIEALETPHKDGNIEIDIKNEEAPDTKEGAKN
jgi:hypothetical protein